MKNSRLIRSNGGMIPGGYPFMDPRTGMKFDGFDAGGFGDQVFRIIKHRLANPRIYPPEDPKWLSVPEVTIELEEYQCLRLGGDSKWCTGTTEEQAAMEAAHAAGVCRFCGGKLQERICPTCSGARRVIGYTCTQCGSTL